MYTDKRPHDINDLRSDTRTLTGPGGLQLVLDRSEVCEEDPGAGTPAMVQLRVQGQLYASTYWCATDTGELLGDRGQVELTPRQLQWLDQQDDFLNTFLYPN